MSKSFIYILVIAVIALGAFVFIKNSESKSVSDLISFVDNASQLVAEKGEGAFQAFNDPNGGWIRGDKYIFVYDMRGKTLVLPPQANLVGTNRIETADPNGEKFVETMVDILSFRSYGWNTYQYVKPGDVSPSSKLSYFKKVVKGNSTYIVGSGIYLAK